MGDLAHHLRQAAHLAAGVGPEEARRLQVQAVSLAALLAARGAELAPEVAPPAAVETAGRPEWLNPAQVETTFGLSPAWLQEHRRELIQLGAVAKVSNKVLLYRAAKLRAFIAGRQLGP